jgi:predicted dehydrogenase
VLAANFYRVISKPDWSAGIADAEKSGGPAIDLHIHDTHFIGWLFGKPARVSSRGVVDQGVVVHLQTNYEYDAPGSPVVSCTSGAISQNGRPFAHGYEIFFERATLKFEYANLGRDHVAYPLTVILPDGKVETPTLAAGGDAITAFENEISVAVNNISGGKHNPMLDGDLAQLALKLCKAEVKSVLEGRPVVVD